MIAPDPGIGSQSPPARTGIKLARQNSRTCAVRQSCRAAPRLHHPRILSPWKGGFVESESRLGIASTPATCRGAWQTAELRRRCAPEALCAYPDASLAIKGREDSKPELYPRPQEADPVQFTRFGHSVGFPFAHLIAHIEQFDLL
jgi:hypothetical protein